MKATGIVRRIDELGRIVIPKELRRTFRIKEGSPLEIFIGDDGELILKKYSQLVDISYFAKEIVESIYQTLNCTAIIFDNDTFISGSGSGVKTYIGNQITYQLEKIIMERQVVIKNKNDLVKLSDNDIEIKSQLISPIVSNGDVCGGIILLSKMQDFKEEDIKVVKTMINFLVKQIS